jgi:predicted nucleic acid-binding protein
LSNLRQLIDTNILIDFLRGHPDAVSFLAQTNRTSLLSTITVAELYSGTKGEHELQQIELLVSHFNVISLTSAIAKKSGLLKKEYQASNSIGIADAVIAATALEHDAKLITLNLKDFPMIEEKEAPY